MEKPLSSRTLSSSSRDPEEQRLRRELANFYHLVDYFGWGELIFNHISVRLPRGDAYLVNPFGLNYGEITPDNLLVVDTDGHLIGESEHAANPAGFALHGAIHAHRHDIHCVAHTHTLPVCAVAMKEAGLDHNNFYGAQLIDRVGYHDFEGITLFADERDRMVSSLGDKNVLILRNHGVAVCERDIPTTFMLLWIVQRACEVQCQTGMIPGPDRAISAEVAERCKASAAKMAESDRATQLLFDAQVRKMRADRPICW